MLGYIRSPERQLQKLTKEYNETVQAEFSTGRPWKGESKGREILKKAYKLLEEYANSNPDNTHFQLVSRAGVPLHGATITNSPSQAFGIEPTNMKGFPKKFKRTLSWEDIFEFDQQQFYNENELRFEVSQGNSPLEAKCRLYLISSNNFKTHMDEVTQHGLLNTLINRGYQGGTARRGEVLIPIRSIGTGEEVIEKICQTNQRLGEINSAHKARRELRLLERWITKYL